MIGGSSAFRGKVPVPPGASVELPHVSAEDAELVRHRGLLDAVCALEFPYCRGGVPPPWARRVAGATLGAGTAPLLGREETGQQVQTI